MKPDLINDDVCDVNMCDVVEGVAWLSQHLSQEVVDALSKQAAQYAHRVRMELARDFMQTVSHLNDKVATIVRLKRSHTRGVDYRMLETTALVMQQQSYRVVQCLHEEHDIAYDVWVAFQASLGHLKSDVLHVLEHKMEFHRGKFFSTTGHSKMLLMDSSQLIARLTQQCLLMRRHWVSEEHDDDAQWSVRTVSCSSFGM